jgi:hypothetical protein
MFKYISDILSKFSVGQRILALILLLLAITIISIGPKIVSSLTYDDTELTQKIAVQKIQMKTMDSTINDLNKQIIANQKKCTDDAIKREKEIIEMINEIQQYIKSKQSQQVNTVEKVYMKNNEMKEVEETLNIPPKKDEKLNNMILNLKKKVSTK